MMSNPLKHWRLKALALMAAVLLTARPAMAELRIDITQGQVEPMPIAIANFQGAAEQEADFGQKIAGVIAANLERSGLFAPVDQQAFIEQNPLIDNIPRFGDWRIINAQALLNGSVVLLPDGRIEVKFRLWDVFAEQQFIGQIYKTPVSGWRRIAHIISDDIYERITGENGYFDTRVVYVAETGPLNRRIKRLAVMDQDGENHQFLTDGTSLVLTPRFSPSQQEITYMSFFNNMPRVYIYNLDTGRQELLGNFPGMTFAPRFSPDGNSVVMSMSQDGNTEIHTMDLRTRQQRRLTRHPAIDTSPSMSPDGNQITFNSDRGGSQQIYVMNSDGSGVRRISFGNGRYATPVWSPRGDLIAFTKMSQGKFYIGVMRTDGTGERLLAEGFLVESPTWSPNGRVLMFFRETPTGNGNKTTKLYSIDLTGFNEREVITPLEASDPAWSPLIP